MRTYELCNDSGATIVAENRSRDKHFTVKLECSGSSNVTPSRGIGDSVDCLPPMHRQVRVPCTPLGPVLQFACLPSAMPKVTVVVRFGRF